MKKEKDIGHIINSFYKPVFKLKAIGEFFFIADAGDKGKFFDADTSNGVSILIQDIADEVQGLVDEIYAKMRPQILEDIKRERVALEKECAGQTSSPA